MKHWFPSNSMRCQYSRLLTKLILAFALVACCSQEIVAEASPTTVPNGNGKVAVESPQLRSFLDTLPLPRETRTSTLTGATKKVT